MSLNGKATTLQKAFTLMQKKTVLSIMMGLGLALLAEDGTTYRVLSITPTGSVKEFCAETIMFTMYQLAGVLLQCIS